MEKELYENMKLETEKARRECVLDKEGKKHFVTRIGDKIFVNEPKPSTSYTERTIIEKYANDKKLMYQLVERSNGHLVLKQWKLDEDGKSVKMLGVNKDRPCPICSMKFPLNEPDNIKAFQGVVANMHDIEPTLQDATESIKDVNPTVATQEEERKKLVEEAVA